MRQSLAYALYKVGRVEESIIYSDKILSLDPIDFYALKRKALSLRILDNFEESNEILSKLLKLNPLEYNAVVILAKNYYTQKKYDASLNAIAQFREVISEIDRSIIPEKEKASIRKIEQEMIVLSSMAITH